MSLSERLQKIRKEFNLTQNELAKIVGSPRQRITDMESGKVKNIKGQELERLEEKYNIDPLWLSVGKGNIFKSSKTFIGVHGINNGSIHFGDKKFPQEIVEIADYLYNNIPPAKYGQIFEIIKNLSSHSEDKVES